MEAIVAILLVFGTGIALIALFAVLSVLFPDLIGRTRRIAESAPRRSLVIGAVNAVFVLAIIAALSALAERVAELLALPAILLLILLVIALAFGLTAVVQIVGARLFPENDERKQVAKGAAALILACLTPFVGWFGLLVYIALLGLGAFVSGFFPSPASLAEAE